LKSAEKQDRLSLLDGVPHALPALAYAQGVQKRPARVGFDETPSVQAALTRMHEALQQVEEMVSTSTVTSVPGEDWALSDRDVTGSQDAEDAVGALLFAVVSLARHLRVIPEEALRRRTTTFADRFRALEAQARQEGVDLHDLDVAEWRTRWKDAATLSNSR
jgi:ATP diphosphatase